MHQHLVHPYFTNVSIAAIKHRIIADNENVTLGVGTESKITKKDENLDLDYVECGNGSGCQRRISWPWDDW